MGSETRKRNANPIKVRVSADEKAQLQALAQACSCTVPELLRCLGLGHQVTGKLDEQAIRELTRLHGELGRLGALLQRWLTQDERWAGTGVERQDICALVRQLSETQAQIKARVMAL